MATLQRKDWVDAAQQALIESGPSELSIVKLSSRLGVTRGSFYYHFKSLNDLIDALISQWEQEVVDKGFSEAQAKAASVGEEVRYLIEFVTHLSDRQDLVLRQWASQNTHVKRHMERLDQKRLAIMTELFQRLAGDKGRGASYAKVAFYGYIGCLNSYPRPSSDMQKALSLEILNLFERDLKRNRT